MSMGAEWLVEEGIGEHRAALVEDGHIIAARLDWPERLAPGLIEDAVLVSRAAGSHRGTARFANGEEALVDRLPRDAREGAPIRLEVTRGPVHEKRRLKEARARPTTADPRPAPSLVEVLRGRLVREIEGWEELWAEARAGDVAFDGGSLVIELTAGLTVIDVDGNGAPKPLCLAAVPAIAGAIRCFDLSGSIAIDFPTLTAKVDRQSVDAALAGALADWPHERTAMNGFGLVQIVARRDRPSLIERLGHGPEAWARLLLRRAERVTEPGVLELSAPERVRNAVRPEWVEELARRTGRQIVWRSEAALAWGDSFAQAVPS